jgi:hypothetical protein
MVHCLRVLDLFAGTQSITRAFQNEGHVVDSLDVDPKFGPTIRVNVLEWDYKQLPRGHYDFIWASCPCEMYSIARSTATRDLALADSLVRKTIEIIEYFQPTRWAIENPERSLLWRRFNFEKIVKTSYCSFGFHYKKTTTIAYSGGELVLPICRGVGLCPSMVGTRHLAHAQKGGGGVMNTYHTTDELHRIPTGLCDAIVAWAIQ